MTIQEVIDWLSNCEYKGTVHGWFEGGSYRGYYDCFSAEPAGDYREVFEMIAVLEDAIGSTFTGYKGGEFTMSADTECFYAPYGSTGPLITRGFLKAMFTDPDFNYKDFE